MPARNNNTIVCWCALLLLVIPCCHSFTPSSKRKGSSSTSCLHYAATDTDIQKQDSNSDSSNRDIIPQTLPKWVPMELIEVASSEAKLTPQEFISLYSDIEAYTSCDDEGDDFHECDFFHQFLGPTKWLHLTTDAGEVMDEVHFKIWKDVWRNPSQAVDLAETVSKECLRYYKEFMLEPRTTVKCPTDRPVIRVKVVPATYGLEGFEDAIWEATEDLMNYSSSSKQFTKSTTAAATAQEGDECCKAITFVVAAPDLFTDPSLLEGSSPQAEFEPDRFQEFSSTLREKMVLFSKLEGVPPLEDSVQLTPFHSLWKLSDYFPYPCVAVSAKIGV